MSASNADPLAVEKAAIGKLHCKIALFAMHGKSSLWHFFIWSGVLVLISLKLLQWKWNKKALPVLDVVVDPYLAYHLRPHQREGVTFLYECVMGFRNYGGYGAILA